MLGQYIPQSVHAKSWSTKLTTAAAAAAAATVTTAAAAGECLHEYCPDCP
jgi:hypothetical protein